MSAEAVVYVTPVTPARAGWKHGKAVVAGRLRYLSPSALEKADPTAPGGCPRRWWFRYVGGHEEPEQPWQRAGTALHAEIECYLRTGSKALSPPAVELLPFVPAPGGDLLVERDMADDVETAVLRAAGVPVLGRMDLLHVRPHWIDPSGRERTDDPPNRAEYVDWKFPGSLDHAKVATELATGAQMTAGGEWLARSFPSLEWIRLSHGYSTRGRKREARKVTTLLHRDQVARSWERVESLARICVDAARETDHAKVDAVASSCDAFGGCPHRSVCQTGSHDSLAGMFGERGAAVLLAAAARKEPDVILDQILKPGALAPAVTPGAPQVTPVVPPQGAGAAISMEAQLRALQCPPGFAEASRAVEVAGRGYPSLTSAAAVARAVLLGQPATPGLQIPGTGDLAGCTLAEPAQMTALAMELGCPPALLVAGAGVPAPIAPAPVIAAPAFPTWPPPPIAAAPVALLPPDAPASDPALAFAKPAVEGEKKPKGRPKKTATPTTGPAPVSSEFGVADPVQAAPVPPVSQPAPAAPQSPAPAPSAAPVIAAAGAGSGLKVLVDCVVDGAHRSIWPLIDQWCSALEKHFGLDAGGLRNAPTESAVGFGKWRGPLAALAREVVRAGGLEPGTWVLDSRGSELGECVAEALRLACHETGALFARGVGR